MGVRYETGYCKGLRFRRGHSVPRYLGRKGHGLLQI